MPSPDYRNDYGNGSRYNGVPAVIPPQPITVDVTAQSSSSGNEMDGLLDMWRIFAQHKWLILGMSLTGLLISFAFTLPQPPTYRAKATLEIQVFNENFMGLGHVDPQAGSYSPSDTNIRTYLQVLRSSSLRKEAAARVQRETIPSLPPQEADWLSQLRYAVQRRLDPASVTDPVVAMKNGLNMASSSVDAKNALGTRIIEISASSTHPVLVADYVNTLINEFIDQNMSARLRSMQRTSQWMRSQVEELRVRLEASEQRLQDFVRGMGGAPPVVEADSQSQFRLLQAEQGLAMTRTERTSREAMLEAANKAPLDEFVLTPEGASLRPLQARLAEQKKTHDILGEKYTPAHQKMQQLNADIAATEAAIERERQVVITRLKREVNDAQQREKLAARAYDRETGSRTVRTDKLMEYNLLKRQVDTDRQLYQSMLQNVNQAGVAAAVPSNNLRVIDPAEASLRSDDTRTWVINLGIGTFTGLLLAVGWSVFSAKASGQMRQPGEATALLRLPELGVIPSQTARRRLPFLPRPATPEPESPGSAVELATWNQKPSLLAESFRGMRASLFGPHTDLRGPKTIVVTSPGPREGKSTVASNLAISLAEAHRRVLLIDADLRSPRMHSVFKLANDRGFSNILNEDVPLETYPLAPVIQATEVPGLSVLTAGSAELTNLGGMFYSSRLVHLLERLRADFDHVVIDTPPLLLFSDARVLGRFSDGVLLVLRAGSTYQTNAVAARQRLADDGVPVLGAVLNDWATKANAGAYGYYYQYQRTS